MTTIFADAAAGVMVCDSRCNGGGVWYPITKVFRVGDELVGIAGSVKDGRTWLKWYQGGKKGPRPKTEDFVALVLRADGLFEHCQDGLELQVERGYHGIGSGGGYALAAHMGGCADAERAVRIACSIDTGSGGDVVVHTLKL
jgi:hypothetical protein